MPYKKKLSALQRAGLLRGLHEVSGPQTATIRLDGREVVNFCSNNYLGLAADPRLAQAADEAMEEFGWGAGSAALISGQMSPHEKLREAIGQYFDTDQVLLFNSGYHANMGLIPALIGETDVIYSDKLNHASIIDGCRLSKGTLKVYPHRDVEELEALLQQHHGPGRAWIVTETVFSMDGDCARINDLVALAQRYDAGLYLDEAHAVGIYGPNGRGVWETVGALREAPLLVRVGTLGKAFGSYGAFVMASEDIIEYVLNKARTFIFTTALPPAVAAASRASLNIAREEPQRRKRLWNNVNRLAENLELSACSPIMPWTVSGNEAVMAATKRLLENGFYVQGIRAPTVAPGTERLRITVSSQHTEEQIDRLVEAIEQL
jgi:glycine C-acetyltransferase